MEKYITKLTKITRISSLILFLVGLFLLIFPEKAISLVSYIIGIIILVNGIIHLIRYFSKKTEVFSFGLMTGIIFVITGIIFISTPETIASIIPFLLGGWIVIKSLIKIQIALNLKSYQSSSWMSILIVSIVTLVFGIIMILNPFDGAVVMTRVIGGFLVVYSILDIIDSRRIKKPLQDGVEFIK